MLKGFMRAVGGKEQEGVPTREIVTTPKAPDLNIRPGRAYVLIGGKTEDMITSCPQCGTPYMGPCQPSCPSCSTQRKVFYTDITNGEILSSIPAQKIGEEASLVFPNKDSVNLGDSARVNKVVASKVNVKYNFIGKVVIAKTLETGWYPRIDTLIIADNGSANIGYEGRIGTLIVGNNVGPVNFAHHCRVTHVFSTGDFTYQAGNNFEVLEQRQIGYHELLALTSKALA